MFSKVSVSRVSSVLLVVMMLIGSAVFVTPAHAAASFTVTDCGDSGAAGQLRTLMNAAASGDTINIPACTITITGAAGEDANVSGDLDFTKSLTLVGAGAGTSIIDGGALDRVLHVTAAFTVNISGVTIRNGNYAGNYGGGIHNDGGTLAITNSTFSGNSADRGGGIFNNGGALTITNSTFSGNSAGWSGGGIYNWAGTATISNSAFSGNSTKGQGGGIYNGGGSTLIVMNNTFSLNNASDAGGGILNQGGTAAITNSTFSGNSAVGGGGGVLSTGTLTITNSTLSSNSSTNFGGGIRIAAGTAILRNTIVANSAAGGNCSGTITNGGNNIDDGTTCGWGSTSGSMSDTDPLLGALIGSPAYFSLDAGSPAIDAGNDAVCEAAPVSNASQNGLTRPQGAHCDIGSVETLRFLLYLPLVIR